MVRSRLQDGFCIIPHPQDTCFVFIPSSDSDLNIWYLQLQINVLIMMAISRIEHYHIGAGVK